jgi:hypothetical protein
MNPMADSEKPTNKTDLLVNSDDFAVQVGKKIALKST